MMIGNSFAVPVIQMVLDRALAAVGLTAPVNFKWDDPSRDGQVW